MKDGMRLAPLIPILLAPTAIGSCGTVPPSAGAGDAAALESGAPVGAVACDDGTGLADCCPAGVSSGGACDPNALTSCATRCVGGYRGHFYCSAADGWLAGLGLFPCGPAATDGGAEAGSPSDASLETHPAPAEPTFETIMASYTAWTKRTDQPVSISAEIFGLCRPPTATETDFQNSVHGKNLALLDWVNPEAAAGFTAGDASPFPVGAAIVKEKLAAGTDGIELVARGFMIKRAAGFNPAAGDWDFAYWEPALGIVSDTTSSAACAGCHASSHASDFVFFDESWRQP